MSYDGGVVSGCRATDPRRERARVVHEAALTLTLTLTHATRAAEAVDVAVRDAHAQEVQPEYDSYNRVATLGNSMWACTHLGRTAG